MEMLPVSFMFFEINNPKFDYPITILTPSQREVPLCQNYMSSSKLRQEDNCLNCGEKVQARFCAHCGQENKEPIESFLSLLVHFIEDLLHYDGKFFSTLRLLFLKPGFLTQEYISGKRVSYIHPIRFYLFTSAFFFLSLFYLFQPLDKKLERVNAKGQVEHKNKLLESIVIRMVDDSNKENRPLTYDAYLVAQNKKPMEQRDSDTEQKLIRCFYQVGGEYTQSEDLWAALLDSMLHKTSTLLFFALPLLAWVLQLVFRKKRDWFYMHHGIFILHVASSYFIFLFGLACLNLIQEIVQWSWLEASLSNLYFVWFGYYFIAFRNYYHLSVMKAIPRFLLTLFLQELILAIIFSGLFLFSFFNL